MRRLHLDRPILCCFALSVLAGFALHGLFDFWPSIVTEFIAPVNESLWEHMKLLFWPVFLSGLYLTSNGRWSCEGWLCALLLSCAVLEGGSWYLHCVAGVGNMGTDIALYLLCLGMAFFLPAVLTLPASWSGPLSAAVIILIGAMICWTIQPPDWVLFHDMSLADAFAHLSC